VQLDRVFKPAGVAAAHQNHDWRAGGSAPIEDALAPRPQPVASQRQATQAVIVKRVDTRLIENQLWPEQLPEAV